MQHTIDENRSRIIQPLSIAARKQPAETLTETPPFTKLESSTTAFIDLHPLPAVVVDSRLMVQYGNEPFRAQFTDTYVKQHSISIAAALGMTSVDALYPAIARAGETGQPQRCTVIVLNREANSIAADIHLVPVQLALQERGCMCFIHVNQQTTIQLRQEPDQERALSDFKSRLYAMIVHDFRTPLFTIRTAASTLGLFFDKMDKQRRDTLIKTIEQSVDNLAGFLSDIEMINSARSSRLTLNYEMVDVPELCTTILKEMQAFCNDSHIFSLSAPGVMVRLQADKRLLSRAVRNLLTNAVKFSPKGSNVLLEVIQTEQEVMIRVQDQGMGIPTNERERVFDTFYRARNVGMISGSGLGLALVKYAVLQQGGSINIDSTEGVGTIITLHFPNATR